MSTYLQASTDVGGPARAEWLAALPDRVDELTARWGWISASRSSRAATALGSRREPTPTDVGSVHKVAWRHTEARHEAEGLAVLGGQGAVEVYAFERLGPTRVGDGDVGGVGDTTAMLLERCRPGTELGGRPGADQHVVITDLL